MRRYMCRDQPYEKSGIKKKFWQELQLPPFFFRCFDPCSEDSVKPVIIISCYIYHFFWHGLLIIYCVNFMLQLHFVMTSVIQETYCVLLLLLLYIIYIIYIFTTC